MQILRKTKPYDNVLSQDYIDALILAAPMHDIGKVAIPDKILQKPDKLTNEEYEIIRKGIGKDFDPIVAQCFLNNKDTVIKIYNDLHI